MSDEVVLVVGLGYVGLPLALAFGRVMQTIGFDISEEKVNAYRQGYDPTGEMSGDLFARANQLSYTTNASEISKSDYVVVAVPTPIDNANQPDLEPLVKASEMVGRNLKKGAIVIFESTVYPGVTEEVCVPILERESGLKCGNDGFKVGYSPERVNPGDMVHTLERIVKVVAGQDSETLEQVAYLYEKVIEAGVHRAATIKVAEAAKVIENTQRDLNIALINELSIIFDKMGVDTLDVLEAAGTKWNFLPFRPGLVGGHCIGVDPYYLTHKAEILGYHPQVILAGRHINDGMSAYVAQQTVKQLIQSGACIMGSKVVVLGLTFKEDCPDLRNSKVADFVNELVEYGCIVSVHDVLADSDEALQEYGISLKNWDDLPDDADAVVLAVGHGDYLSKPIDELLVNLKPGGVVIDVKSALDRDEVTSAGYSLWRL
jgi:UDP-N-acetyl-D-glucosamine/UDP-N-acetyl-D-galactosamine dehydrogenase